MCGAHGCHNKMDAVVCLLERLGFADLAPFFRRHHVPWVACEALYASTLLPASLKARFEELKARVGKKRDAQLHVELETRHEPLFRAASRVRALERHLKGDGVVGLRAGAGVSEKEVGEAMRTGAGHATLPPRPTPHHLIAAKLHTLAQVAHAFSGTDDEAATCLFDRLLESLRDLQPMAITEAKEEALPVDAPFSSAEVHAIGVPLGCGRPWNGAETLCPLFDALHEPMQLCFLRFVGVAMQRIGVPYKAPWRCGEWLVVPMPPVSQRRAAYDAISALLLGVLLEVRAATGIESGAEAVTYTAAEQAKLEKLATQLRLQTRAPDAPAAVALGRQLVRDGGLALLEGREPVPPTLPHAAALTVWLGAAGDRAGAAEGFGFQERGRLLFFVGLGVMTAHTYPLWRAKAARHEKCARDLISILEKCADRRAAHNWSTQG